MFGFGNFCQNNLNKLEHHPFPHISISIHCMTNLSPKQIYEMFPKALSLNFISNIKSNINQVCNQKLPLNMLCANFGQNNVTYIMRGCFVNNVQLRILLLDYNKISFIQSLAFRELLTLKFLSLSRNPLNEIKGHLFGIF